MQATPQRWKVGAITITRVIESEVASSARWILPDASRENMLSIAWLQPHFCNAEGRAIMSLHSFIIESAGARVLVDTCVGNDKRRELPAGTCARPFLSSLREAGHPAEAIDRVLCTHLHVDHVGWNTRLVDGKLGADVSERALPVRAHRVRALARRSGATRARARSCKTRCCRWSTPAWSTWSRAITRVAEGIRLQPTPGHTPGHVSVRIESQGERAVITGDLLHHPAQCAHPEWASSADVDPVLARRTRRDFLAACADAPTLVLGTHFATPTAGRIVRDGDAFRLVV